jgi:FkbM family methyltransferase
VINSILKRIKIKAYSTWGNTFGYVPFTDKFGVRYYLWPDYRLENFVFRGVGVDDEGVFLQSINILSDLVRTKKNIVCFDVGAHVGETSLLFSKYLGTKGKVYAFEPTSKALKRFEKNVRLNNASNIQLFRLGVSDKVASGLKILLTKKTGSECILSETHPSDRDFIKESDGNRPTESIDTTSIDTFCKESMISEIDLLKVDAELCDDKVLLGASQMLRANKIHYIIVEFEEGTQCSARVLKCLEKFQYKYLFMVRRTSKLVEKIEDYPFDSHKSPLNLLAMSSQRSLPLTCPPSF